MSESEQPESEGSKIQGRKQTSKRQSKRRQSNRRQSRRQSRHQSQRRQSRRQSGTPRKSSQASGKFSYRRKTLTTAEDVVSALKNSTEFLESPIDLCRESIDTSELNPLHWQNYYANPLFLKMTNTTHTVVLNGLYPTHYVPTLSGGPLLSPYKFVQLHFHWGEHNDRGSEHKVEGDGYPLEAHVVLYKAEYETYDIAKSMEDGVVILVYMFQTHDTSQIKEFTKYLPKLKDPYSQIPIDTVSLQSFLPPLVADYVLYFGYMAASCNHGILWLVCRSTMGVTEAELEDFRNITATSGVPIGHNFRETKPTLDRVVLFVNTEKDTKRVVHSLPQIRKRTGTVRSTGRRESRRTSKRSSKVAKRSSKVAKRSSKVANKK